MITTIIFDLGGVLVNLHPEKMISCFLKQTTKLNEKDLITLLKDSTLFRNYEAGKIDSNMFYREVTRRLEADFTFNSFRSCWENMFSPNRSMIDLLEKLKKRCRLIILSNTNELHIQYLQTTYDFFAKFDHKLYSYESGLMKPDPEIYRLAAELANAPPENCLFVDDSLQNVKAAEKAQMSFIHFRNFDGFVSDLKLHEVEL